MTARRIGVLAVLTSMVGSGWYVVLYLGRWEWNRAIVAGVIFLAAETGLLGVLLLDRLAQLRRELHERDRSPAAPVPTPSRILVRVREAAPTPRRPFAWLERSGSHTSVFVPVLLGAGVVLSGVAWIVERLGRMSGGPILEQRLAHRLEALALPPGGLLGADHDDPFSPAP